MKRGRYALADGEEGKVCGICHGDIAWEDHNFRTDPEQEDRDTYQKAHGSSFCLPCDRRYETYLAENREALNDIVIYEKRRIMQETLKVIARAKVLHLEEVFFEPDTFTVPVLELVTRYFPNAVVSDQFGGLVLLNGHTSGRRPTAENWLNRFHACHADANRYARATLKSLNEFLQSSYGDEQVELYRPLEYEVPALKMSDVLFIVQEEEQGYPYFNLFILFQGRSIRIDTFSNQELGASEPYTFERRLFVVTKTWGHVVNCYRQARELLTTTRKVN